MAGQAEGPETGWKTLDNWGAQIAGVINDNHDECVQRDFHSRGDPVASGVEAAAEGASGGDFETVTGAVNGVPATLQVATDGNGWTEI